MNLSDDTQKVIQFLEYLGVQLRKKNDFALILEISATYNLIDELTKLIFSSASVWNLSKTLKKVAGNPNALLLENELHKGIEELLNSLREIIDSAEVEYVKRFQNIYFQNTDGAIRNLIDLAHDFSAFKDIQNQSKKISKSNTKN